MFQAVRKWAGSGRAKHTVRLFIFELTVVTLGVLIAQWVQGVAQDRAALTHMEDERQRARHELERVNLVAHEWAVAVPCLDQRMTEIMAGTEADTRSSLRRPSFNNPRYAPPDEAASILIDRRYGHREKAILTGIDVNVGNIRSVVTKMIDQWGKFALLDPANGPVGPADRSAARSAAADIKAQLRSAAIISDDTIRRLGTIGIGMSDDEYPGRGPAHSCAAIWRSGRMDPLLAER